MADTKNGAKMKVTRQQAIKIIDRTTGREGGFDDWWVDLMESLDLYDEDSDTWPSFYDVMEALGVSKQEIDNAKAWRIR